MNSPIFVDAVKELSFKISHMPSMLCNRAGADPLEPQKH